MQDKAKTSDDRLNKPFTRLRADARTDQEQAEYPKEDPFELPAYAHGHARDQGTQGRPVQAARSQTARWLGGQAATPYQDRGAHQRVTEGAKQNRGQHPGQACPH